jgi:hypothetical protein
VDLRDGKLMVEFGGVGSPDALRETDAYRRAERVLGRPPTALVNSRKLVRLMDPGGNQDLGSVERMAFLAVAERTVRKEHWQDILVELAPGKGPAPEEPPEAEISWLAPGGAATSPP